MAEDPSSSVHWREQGNQIYVTAHSNLSPLIRKDRLRQADNLYHKALNFSRNAEDKVSAEKNLAMTGLRMTETEESDMERVSYLVHWYKQSFKFFSDAYSNSQDVKDEKWRDGVLTYCKQLLEMLKAGRLQEMSHDDRKPMFYDIVAVVHIPCVKADIYTCLANLHFHCGITCLQNSDYKTAMYEFKECHFPVIEAKRLGKDSMPIMAEARILEEDCFMHSCMAESIQAREIGDSLFRKVLLEEENIDMNMVYEMIDWYKQAILRTREVTEVELEAIALSRMGRVYDKILKIKCKAKEYLMRSIQLAHSMHPKTFNNEEWFKECSSILERYQKETVLADEAVWQKERAELVKELVKEMTDISKNDEKGSEDFLKFVYCFFPPKNTSHKLEGVPKKKGSKMDHGALKKVLQKAICHYHLDRVDSEKHGKIWKVIAEEITKCLTRRYEGMK